MPKPKISMISKNLIKFVRSLEQKKIRDRERMFVAEGPKVVGDLMAINKPVAVVATDEWFNANSTTPGHADAVVSNDELRKISFLQHPQQVLAIFRIRILRLLIVHIAYAFEKKQRKNILLVCSCINIGSKQNGRIPKI